MIYKSKGGVKTAILVFAKWMALHFLYCSSLLKSMLLLLYIFKGIYFFLCMCVVVHLPWGTSQLENNFQELLLLPL